MTLINSFCEGIKIAGQAELANYHINFNQVGSTIPTQTKSNDAAELVVYDNGGTSWVSIALNRKMSDISGVEYFFVNLEGERIENNKVSEKILNPINSGYNDISFPDMIGQACGHEDLTGNGLWLKNTSKNRFTELTKIVGEFIIISPGRFKIIQNSKRTKNIGYEITWHDGTRTPHLPEDVIQFKRNAIINQGVGIGLIAQGRLSVESELVMQEYQLRFLENDGTPALTYIDKNISNPEQAKSKAAELRARYKEMKYQNSIMYAYGDVDIKAFSVSASDMQYIDSRKMNKEEIISLMESSGSVLGVPDANNRASAGFLTNNYFGVVNSRIKHLVDIINNQFVHMIDPNISLSFQPHPVGNIEEETKAIVSGLSTPAESSKRLGRPYDDKDVAQNSRYISKGVSTLDLAFDPPDFGFVLNEPQNDIKKKLRLNPGEM
ncbi:MAG: phage portal protein [bacterium]|nr:phage portal protein [bacterium]